jgi:hypothetical protein
MVLHIAPGQIAHFKALVESYDNLATLRTADPARHHLKLWYQAGSQAEIDALLDEMRKFCTVEIIQPPTAA